MNKKIRYAVVGLGHIAQTAVLPAFEHAENSELAALVTGNPEKDRELSERYGVKAYTYDDLEDALDAEQVDAVYIATPNILHREHTERTARAGAHVLCEKPMATTEEDCRAMMRAAEQNNVKLMIAYRLHFNDANLRAVELARSGELGELRYFGSLFGLQVKAGNIRVRKDLGGGTLYDIGIYCINAARYLFRDEPIEVVGLTMNNGEERFAEVEEMTGALLRFPDERLAMFTCSFGSADVAQYDLIGTKGRLRLENAYEYLGELKCVTTIDGKTTEKIFKPGDQFAPELIYFSNCILNDRAPEPSDKEGLADVRVINAIYESAKTGQLKRIEPVPKQRRPEREMEIKRPPVKEPELVGAAAARSG
ncbi:MAG: gfo/Idh/MocA family oxidoreductase [Verrucomicrobia bacterium]|nr:MAG: gfo/Idh/MocA family oxidoreductase [Verrucomicrobiota bacterium]PYJ93706.1 MAG: gfo/Idh/MocA family oxidoreductase [Verrucomicrobiota bacterium]PYK36409.1 MAG: gfo/Idh/MocA family oxidoreductase [Verrucomicrobiota bacterium]PYL82612.1 MAG: gfo/Idh/MocA family oxidoreductase [Verrucomicrobiota bacterium]